MAAELREHDDTWEPEIQKGLESKFPGHIQVTKTEVRRVYA